MYGIPAPDNTRHSGSYGLGGACASRFHHRFGRLGIHHFWHPPLTSRSRPLLSSRPSQFSNGPRDNFDSSADSTTSFSPLIRIGDCAAVGAIRTAFSSPPSERPTFPLDIFHFLGLYTLINYLSPSSPHDYPIRTLVVRPAPLDYDRGHCFGRPVIRMALG